MQSGGGKGDPVESAWVALQHMVNIASVSASAFVSAACVAVFYSSTLAQPRPARVRPVSRAASSCCCCCCCCFVISFDIACHSSFCFHCNFLPCCTQLTAIAATAAVPLVPLTPPHLPPSRHCLFVMLHPTCLPPKSCVCVGVSHCVICAPRAC